MSTEAEVLKQTGLVKCYWCKRILRPTHLYKGRCRDLSNCATARMIAGAIDDPEFVRGIELGVELNNARRV